MIEKIDFNGALYLSFFLIFIRVLPIGVETQPVIALLISVIYIFALDIKELTIIKKDIFATYLLMVVLIVYSCFDVLIRRDFLSILELVKYLIGPVIFIAVRKANFTIRIQMVKYIVYVLLSLALLNLFIPSVYIALFEYLIPRFAGNAAGGARGITILTPEPSYFAVFEIILLITIEKGIIQNDSNSSMNRTLYTLKYIVIFISLLTKSALVILFALIFLIPDTKKINVKKIAILLLGITILALLVTVFFSENRLFEVIRTLYNLVANDEFNLTNFLFNQESSGGTRIIVNFLAIASMFSNPLGAGLGSFSKMLEVYAIKYDLDLTKHEVLGSDEINKIYPQTYFANLCNDVGILSLLLFPIIMLNNDKSSTLFSRKKNICLLLMLFFQSQITNPAFWFLLAVSKMKTNEKIIK